MPKNTMKTLYKLALFFLIFTSTGLASSSHISLIAQPIYNGDQSDRASWGDIDYKILDVLFLDAHYHGHPAYSAISKSHRILTNSRSLEDSMEINLLAMMGITVHADITNKDVWLKIDTAKKPKHCSVSIEDAVYLALECIRITAHREHGKPNVRITAPKDQKAKWLLVEKRFQAHDLSKPFTKSAKQVVAPDS